MARARRLSISLTSARAIVTVSHRTTIDRSFPDRRSTGRAHMAPARGESALFACMRVKHV
jgi:hypothetical protein